VPTLKQLERALINADEAGDEEAARALAAEIKRIRARQAEAKKPKVSSTEAVLSGAERGLKPISDFARALNPFEYAGDVIENYFFPGLEQRRAAKEQKRRQQAAQAEAQRPGYFLGGKIGGEVVGTAPLIMTGGGVIAGGGRMLTSAGGQMVVRGTTGARAVQTSGRALEATGRAIQTGGVGVRAPTRAAVAGRAPIAATRTGRMALRVGGGGTAGAAGAALTDQDIFDAAQSGAIIPLVGTIARRGVGHIYDIASQRVGKLRAAEMMRNLLAQADSPSAIEAALRDATPDARQNTAQFLAEQGLLTPEIAAATRIATASSQGIPLTRVALAREAGQKEMLSEVRGGATQAEAMENINAMREGARRTAEPYRHAAMSAANVGRNVILPLERQAQAFDLGAADINRSGIVPRMRGLETRSLEQLDAVFQNPAFFTPGRVVERIGEVAEQAGHRADEGIETQLFMRDQARIARAIADDLRAQGYGPIDISPVVGRMRELAREAYAVSPQREKLFTSFADALEARAARDGGVIDAEGLHLAKREMNEFVSSVLGQTDPSAIKRGTSMMLGASQKLIDDALNEAAGPGTPFAEFNRVFSQGMRRVEQQEFARELTKLPPTRFEKVMNNEDPEFVSEFFPGELNVNNVLTPAQRDTARKLNREIAQEFDIEAAGLRSLPTRLRRAHMTGAKSRAEEAMQPGMKNMLARLLIRARSGAIGGSIAPEQIAGAIAQEVQDRAMRHLVPALADPQAAARLLAQRPTPNRLADIVNRVPPAAPLMASQATQRFQAAPAAAEAVVPMIGEGQVLLGFGIGAGGEQYPIYGAAGTQLPDVNLPDISGEGRPFSNINYDEYGNYIGPRR